MAPQDQYLDDEEETCPLCIEEFDLSDKNFRPCPCGYQVCQFCFHNIKNNINGLCPACRRPYDEKTIQYKAVTAEEQAEFRARQQTSKKKRAELQGQKEIQRRDTEKDARKNLVGIRVVQKNLVYVTGLTPTVREDELLKTLRQPQFFGQYGNIQKISISNRKTQDGHNQSLGIYVTFEKKEDAQRCIQAVNGSQNGERILKAQLGTTKYCSAWLRYEQCNNRQCMFLHELGDEEDSYTRQDLSSLNSAMQTQRPYGGGNSSRSASRQQGPPPQSYQAPQPMVRTSSKDGSESGDAPALPASANWARSQQQRSRRGSHATSGAASSPAVSMSLPATTEATEEAIESAPQESPPEPPVVQPEPAAAESSNDSLIIEPPEPKNPWDTALIGILKSLGGAELILRPVTPDDTIPPLFDPRGGERRRAMRDEEERQMDGEHEQQQTAPVEPLEPEGEPESGSLALGGEPEEREEQSRETHAFEQRRSIAQVPIQRTNTEGLFGPNVGSAGFAQGTANVASIGNRTMTPQQQAYMRPQASFAESMPPGINASQSALFQGQGQGHSRQTSRYSFANESQPSANAVKLATNPRLMAQQQASMLPSTFPSQPSGQYYSSSSMPGPPPGLKSTGTPPAMFGQGNAFGSSGFGAKDSNDVLQNLIRSRAGGVGQGHDANKREYIFPSFPNQYPPSSSSTPAPASAGFMGALYNGAYQDLGAKQKKKGKKHRHANTSSSGGSGLVDLADPSILQARIQHHQQSNAGVGSGLFGGQAQGGYNPNMLYNSQPQYRDEDDPFLNDATNIVDALVSDDPTDEDALTSADAFQKFVVPTTPAVPPPGLGFASHSHPPRTATPLQAPPGIVGPAIPSSGGLHSNTAASPAVSLKPASGSPASTADSTHTSKKGSEPATGTQAKKNIKALALDSGLSMEIASQANISAKGKKPLLQDEDFPALESAKPVSRASTPAPAKAPSIKTPMVAKKVQVETPKTATTPTASEPPAQLASAPKVERKAERKVVPGVLNIAAATKAASAAAKSNPPSTVTSAVEKADEAAFPALPTPNSFSVSSPATRVPKTLRVVSTPKAETPPSMSAGAVAPASLRHAFSTLQRPETPGSADVSDTASILSASASASASRTNSPPPGPSRVGSAAVRNTTKSQQRKARKDATKKEAAAIAVQTKPEPEVVIAPILGRKKKQKKEPKQNLSKEATQATESRPQSPGPAERVAEKDGKLAAEEKVSTYRQAVNESMSLEEPLIPRSRRKEGNASSNGEGSKSVSDRPVPPPAAVLQELASAGWITDVDALGLLRSITSTSHRSEQYTPVVPRDGLTEIKSMLSEEDQQALLSGKPVHKIIDGSRVLLTPNGNCVRNLTPTEEQRYLELLAELAARVGDPATYVHSRHEAGNGFSVIKGRAVANGTPSYFPQGGPAIATVDGLHLPAVSDPMQKMTREEALANINQSILPRLNLGTANLNTLAAVPDPKHPINTSPSPDQNNNPPQTPLLSKQDLANATNALNSLAPLILNFASSGSPSSTAALAAELTGQSAGSSLAKLDPADEFSGMANTMTAMPSMPSLASSVAGKSGNMGGASSSPLANFPMMSVEDMEQAFTLAKKEAEKMEKSLNQVIKKNRKLLSLSASGAGGGH
ncbi:transcriptional repressor general negative regulator of transcription subunit 4 [Diaporthe australafricana]|uniref:Transcriptional repressor general negative regulator of transcription subunit 4 n=1 Tax=Diaporthe australafricana TaxID=127596 RepID=A0ABR3WWS3_9PEZI